MRAAIVFVIGLAALAGCRDAAPARDSVGPSDAGAAGRARDAGSDGDLEIEDPPPVDGGTEPAKDAGLNGCSELEDHTAADPTIVWIRTVGTKCLRITKGQSVTWDPADGFDLHPLIGFGGTTPTPIEDRSSGDAPYKVTFTSAGTFGFVCAYHANMRGVIEVVEGR